ncbi:unnamed protein product [Trichogramma brassicae]|uniref:Uncharacterized protein n=1 Tax=Trichogramma brassicae TaxID=86971 RepID=A0A6H5IL96_9HYME|nr:unnamed protein product [Trichogramma brassicae]
MDRKTERKTASRASSGNGNASILLEIATRRRQRSHRGSPGNRASDALTASQFYTYSERKVSENKLPAGRARGSGTRSRVRERNTLQLLKKLRLPRGQNPHRRRFSLIVARPDYDDDDNQSRPLRVLYILYILYGLDHVNRDKWQSKNNCTSTIDEKLYFHIVLVAGCSSSRSDVTTTVLRCEFYRCTWTHTHTSSSNCDAYRSEDKSQCHKSELQVTASCPRLEIAPSVRALTKTSRIFLSFHQKYTLKTTISDVQQQQPRQCIIHKILTSTTSNKRERKSTISATTSCATDRIDPENPAAINFPAPSPRDFERTAAAAAAVAAAATLLTPTTTSLSYSLRGSPVVLMLADNVPIVCPNVPGHIASAWARAPAVAYVCLTMQLCRCSCTTQLTEISQMRKPTRQTHIVRSRYDFSYRSGDVHLSSRARYYCDARARDFGSNPCEAYYIRLNYAIKVDELLQQEDFQVHRLRASRLAHGPPATTAHDVTLVALFQGRFFLHTPVAAAAAHPAEHILLSYLQRRWGRRRWRFCARGDRNINPLTPKVTILDNTLLIGAYWAILLSFLIPNLARRSWSYTAAAATFSDGILIVKTSSAACSSSSSSSDTK